MLKEKERRAKKAEVAEANIQAHNDSKTGAKQRSSQAIPKSPADGAMGVQTTVDINSSFGSAMDNHQDHLFPNRRLTSATGSTETSGSDSSSWRNSFDSAQDNRFCVSPATTFSSISTPRSSFGLRSMASLPEKVGDRLKRGGKKNKGKE